MTAEIDWDSVPDVEPGPERDYFGVYRNGNNQPLIRAEDGSKRYPYRRTTNFIDQLKDGGEGLRIWTERLTLAGLVMSPELRKELMAWMGEPRELSDIARRAARLAGRDEKQEWGSMLHQITDAIDKGDMMPRQWWNENTKQMEPVPVAEVNRDVEAYRMATRCLTHHAAEQMHVFDPYRVAGTPDRVSSYSANGKRQGRPKIVDLKTGTLHPRMVEAQLAMYSRSRPYDPQAEVRLDAEPVDQKRGIVIHLPMKQARCELFWADLTKGWADCKVARDKHQKGLRRKLETLGRLIELGPDVPLMERVGLCANVDALRDLWKEAVERGELTEDLKAACLERQRLLAPTSK
ncbi:hypothetical protein [Mycobacteroides abscessus]|uniref:hypothetical protein n=1 Tax=Mycobacteroides abscessus TaxID=36809 RepID=UPI00092936C5|nr:hypothetical protein [Mycobacteroides abscessus]SIJ98481.1 Uncharacterised protein [Mycobacteroides abscessus subsp. abscessus]